MSVVSITKNLNLVVPLERDAGLIYVHSTPVAYELFQRYYFVLAKTFNAITTEGLNVFAGPRVAWLLMQDIAKSTIRGPNLSWWEGPDGIENGLGGEMRRLSNVLMPVAGKGYDTRPFQDALDEGYFSEEEAGEVLNQLAFFTVVSRVPHPTDRPKFILGGCRMSNSQTTSLNATEFAASLKISTKAAPTGEKKAPAQQSSVPS